MLLTVEISDATRIRDSQGQELSFDDLAAGQTVRVQGNLDGDAHVAAESLLVLVPEGQTRVREGIVTALDREAGEFQLAIRPPPDRTGTGVEYNRVIYGTFTEVFFFTQPLSTDDLTDGQLVRVRGEHTGTGDLITAAAIQIEPVRFHAFVTEKFCPDAMRVRGPRARLWPLEVAGITLVPENSAVVRLDGDFGHPTEILDPEGRPISCEEVPFGRAVFVTGRMVPHEPEPGVDENPFQVRAQAVRLLPPAHLRGEVVAVTAAEKRFRLRIFAVDGLFERPDGTSVEHEVTVRVTAETKFLAPLTGDLEELMGREVGVLGLLELGPALPDPEILAFGVALLSSLPDEPER